MRSSGAYAALALGLAMLLCLRHSAAEAEPTSEPARAFLSWARTAIAPVSVNSGTATVGTSGDVDRMIGQAKVVGLTEGVHLAAEPLEFRNRLFEHLVDRQGFTAIALESGLVEGRTVNAFVRGGPGDLDEVMRQGFSWTFGRLPQNRALVAWMRAYNAVPGHRRKISFYGFDVPGSPANVDASRGVDTALHEALAYLSQVDPAEAVEFHARLDALLPELRFDLAPPPGTRGYDQLSSVDRDSITSAIADLVALFARKEAAYVAVGGRDNYVWGYRAAIGARQIDSWLRQIPLDWRAERGMSFPSERTRFLSAAADVRDRAQADNLAWILEREGPEGRVLVYAHRFHLSAAPVKSGFWLPPGEDDYLQQTAGTYLRRRLGAKYVVIGALIGGGSVGCGTRRDLGRPPSGSLERILGQVSSGAFLIDLRTTPSPVRRWLATERQIGEGHDSLRIEVGSAYDILSYFPTLTPACP